MAENQPEIEPETNKTRLTSYVIGFVLSVMLTLAAYWSVVNNYLAGNTLVAVIVGLAIAQLLVQLVFFLHLGRESKPRWNATAFLFMGIVLIIIVFGSLWIMDNLDYHMMQMTPQEKDQYMLENEGSF